jgi:hypothetical protein
VYWLDGIVYVDGTDILTIGEEADGPVKIDFEAEQVMHSGSAAVDTIMDEVKLGATLTVTGIPFSTRILENLLGFTKTSGYLEDGSTPADIHAQAGSTGTDLQRPVVELLIRGNKTGSLNPNTGQAHQVEIWAARAKVQGTPSWSLTKEEHSKVEIVFKLLADPDDRTADWLQIRDTEQYS